MKLCLVCASGGHLTEMLRLNDAFKGHEAFLITYREEFLDRPDPAKVPSNITRKYFIENYMVMNRRKGLPSKMLKLMLQLIIVTARELSIFVKEKPDVIVSTGSGIAIPAFYLGRFMGKKLIFVESLCRTKEISHTGKMIRPISDHIFVQWESLTKKYDGTIYKGNLLDSGAELWDDSQEKEERFIFVSVGTSSFSRLIMKMDEIAPEIGMKVIMQIGRTEYEPKNAEYFRFTEYKDFLSHIRRGKIIVMHPGVGTLITVLGLGKKPIVAIRSEKYGECLDDDQNDIIRVLAKEGRVDLAVNVDDILEILRRKMNEPVQSMRKAVSGTKNEGLTEYLKNVLSKIRE